MHQAATDPADRRNMQFARTNVLLEKFRPEGPGAFNRRVGIIDPQPDIADRSAVHHISGMGKSLPFGVDDDGTGVHCAGLE